MMTATDLDRPAVAFDPPTELVAAATSISLADKFGVTMDMRAQLQLALDGMPTEGLLQPWYNLVDLARRYLRDHGEKPMAPRFDFSSLIACAVDAGEQRRFHWQEYQQ